MNDMIPTGAAGSARDVGAAALPCHVALTGRGLSLMAFCVLLCPIAVYFGASAHVLLSYLLYVLLFNIIPGTLFYCCLVREWSQTRGLAVIGWIVGLCLEVTLYDVMDQFGLVRYFHLYPVLFIAVCGFVTFRRDSESTASPEEVSLFFAPFLVVVVMSVVFIAIAWFTPITDTHFAEQANIANAILRGWPYEYSNGIPLFYNYLGHTHIAAASRFTGAPALDLASRSVPFVFVILCLLAIYVTGIGLFRNRWIGVLVIAQIFGMVGYQDIQTNFLGSAIPSAAVLVISTLAAFPIFLALSTETLTALSPHVSDGRVGPGRFLLLLLLLWTASGMRFPALAAFGAGIAGCFVWDYARRRIVRVSLLLLAVAIVAVVGLSLVRFYGALSPLSATKFLEFVPGPAMSFDRLNLRIFRVVEATTGLPYQAAGGLTFLLMTAGAGTFLAPGIFWLLVKRGFFSERLNVFWLSVLVANSAIWCFSFAEGGSHGTFLHYAHFALAFLGAHGLCDYLADPKDTRLGLFIGVLTIAMAFLHFGELGYYLANTASGHRRYQSTKPVALAGTDYGSLIKCLEANKLTASPYVVVGDMTPALNLALSAEIVGLPFGGRALDIMLKRTRSPALLAQVAMIDALNEETHKDTLDSSVLIAVKQGFPAILPATMVVGNSNGFEKQNLVGNGWICRAGRFAVLLLQ